MTQIHNAQPDRRLLAARIPDVAADAIHVVVSVSSDAKPEIVTVSRQEGNTFTTALYEDLRQNMIAEVRWVTYVAEKIQSLFEDPGQVDMARVARLAYALTMLDSNIRGPVAIEDLRYIVVHSESGELTLAGTDTARDFAMVYGGMVTETQASTVH